ncbi:nucleoside diphosphate kinase regulator [Rhizobium sp. Td3]|nr:nucleoside diphosphate kinase regulator [Rhizobium sp. RM]TMV21913.1 nucleoside diphosphate kinase regulator [Rhizobium sp. Td3]
MDVAHKSKPSITIARSEYERLTRLADSQALQNPEVSDALLTELERARIVDDLELPEGVVRMGSSLRYTSDLGEDRQVTLVYPGEADIAEGKISIMTPIGAALIGLSSGQSIDWTARDNRIHRLTVETVKAPIQIK